MIVVNVYVSVKPEMIKQFIEATLENAKNSIKEPGIVRFDVVQSLENSSDFLLVEVYKSEQAILKHKETLHYNTWRRTVENMMLNPRKSIKYKNIFPQDNCW